MEFLGDAVLSLIVSEYLFHQFPSATEGELTELRAKIVSRKKLNEIGRKMKLIKFFGYRSRKQLGENLEGNALEALTGAIYLDQGYDEAKKFVHKKILSPYINLQKVKNSIESYKDALLKWGQKHKKKIDFSHQYEASANGNGLHQVTVYVEGALAGRGRNNSKKKAEEIACKNAYNKFAKKPEDY